MAENILGTSGNDNLENTIAGAIIYGYEGNDSITNSADDVTILGGDGKDYIYNSPRHYYDSPLLNNSIDSGNDNDYIESRARNTTVSGGDGHDTIDSEGNETSLIGGVGNDSIKSEGDDAKLYGGDGTDTLQSRGNNSYIDGGNDNDNLYSGRGYVNVTMNGGAGDDKINANGSNSVTINGGTGNDNIDISRVFFVGNNYYTSAVIEYANGDGDDTVTGFDDSDTLNISSSYSTQESGNDVLVNVGNGSILLQGAKGTTLNITGGTSTTSGGGDDTVTTQSGGNGLVIDNDNPNTLISGTNYADLIDNSGNYATINTYAGNDTVSNWGDTIKIDTGSGDDSIYSYSYYGTITAGSGNDTVSLNSSAHDNIIAYTSGDGNDIIYNLGTNNTLSISGGNYSTQTSGSDILVNVGSGTITLAGSTSANIIGSSGTTTSTQSANNHLYTGGNAVISSYSSEQIVVGMLPKEWMFYGSDFYYGSNTGTLVVQNVKNKIIDFRDGNGNSFVKAYSATNSGTIDGRGLSGFEYIVGSEYGADAIFAGDGGSSLWGGNGSYDDTLIGGAATDVFVSGKSQGNDVISNASIADVIWLRDVNFSDISYTTSSNGTMGIRFNTGNSLLVGSTNSSSAIFQFADGSARRYYHITKSWYSI